MKGLAILLLTVAGVYVLIVASTWSFQRRLLYFPSPERISPADAGLQGVEEIALQTADTRRLLAWYAAAPSGRPTILYFHGNGGGLVNRADRIELFRSEGFGILLVTYRGYAGSSDKPAEVPIIRDALHSYQWLVKKGVSEQKIILYGESLGTGVAVAVAAQNKPGAVVLEAPFTSAVDVGAAHYPWLPVRWFMKDRFDSMDRIDRVTAPVLIFHGENDQVIPIKLGRRLFAAANQPKASVWLPDAGHNDLYSNGVWPRIKAFLERHVAGVGK